MIRIVFNNLEESQLVRDTAIQKIHATVDRFPDLIDHRMTLTLSMDNSPTKPGPDLFTVKLRIVGKKYSNIFLEKSATNLYIALADVVEHALERLNRFGDKKRVKQRNRERKLLKQNRTQQGDSYEKNSI